MKTEMKTTPNLDLASREEPVFSQIVQLIQSSRQQALETVNTVLIDLYWKVGEIISRKLESAEWGDGVVPQLAAYIAQTQPGLRGFTLRNLFRMRQFYEAYRDDSSPHHSQPVQATGRARVLPQDGGAGAMEQTRVRTPVQDGSL